MRFTLVAGAALAAAAAQPAWAGGSNVLTVSAVVLSKSNCRFSGPASTILLSVDPANATPASAGTSVTFRCTGSAPSASWSLSHGAGLHGANPSALRMRHATAASEFLPYSLTYPPSGSTAKNAFQTVTVTATVAAADAKNVLPGIYTDQVTLSLLP